MLAAYPVTLYRNSTLTAWGFRLQGGADLHTPIIVQRVFAGSPAEGQLQRGDILVGIENYDATCLLHREAQELVRTSGASLSLNVKRTQGGRFSRGQSVGPSLGRQQLPQLQVAQAPAYPMNQPQFHQPSRQAYQQSTRSQAPQQQQHGTDQYNLYVSKPHAPQRQRSESTSHVDTWQRQQQQQQQDQQQKQQQQQQHRQDQQQKQQFHQPIFAQQPPREDPPQRYSAYQDDSDSAMMRNGGYPADIRMTQRQTAGQGNLAAQRSVDDDEVDYSFTRQSVAERSRAFMHQQQHQQPANLHTTVGYHSVPRTTVAPSVGGGRYRSAQPRGPTRTTFENYGGGHGPLGEFGWSPSADKLRQARRHPGQPASQAAFEQSSYLPSRGIGRTDSPTTLGVAGSKGARAQQRHSVSGGVGSGGNGGGGYYPANRGGPRYVSSSTGSADEPVNNENNNYSGIKNNGVDSAFAAFNNRQYNTPINLYSTQNQVSAFEGQIGMQVGQRQQQTVQQPARGHSAAQSGGPQPISQSQVYKLVHEQDNQSHQQRQRGGDHRQEPFWTAASSGSRRRDSDAYEQPGVSEF